MARRKSFRRARFDINNERREKNELKRGIQIPEKRIKGRSKITFGIYKREKFAPGFFAGNLEAGRYVYLTNCFSK